jgi:hypothetical protein
MINALLTTAVEASATFSPATCTTSTTAPVGYCSVIATANTTGSPTANTVTASAGGVASPAVFSLTNLQGTPVLAWATPAAISYGTALLRTRLVCVIVETNVSSINEFAIQHVVRGVIRKDEILVRRRYLSHNREIINCARRFLERLQSTSTAFEYQSQSWPFLNTHEIKKHLPVLASFDVLQHGIKENGPMIGSYKDRLDVDRHGSSFHFVRPICKRAIAGAKIRYQSFRIGGFLVSFGIGRRFGGVAAKERNQEQ